MEVGSVAKVLKDFFTTTSGELSLVRGDIVQVISIVDRFWCQVRNGNTKGSFPINNLFTLDLPDLMTGQALFIASADFNPQESGDIMFIKGEFIIGDEAIDENWWKGHIGNRKGIFPLTHAWMVDTNSYPNIFHIIERKGEAMNAVARVIQTHQATNDGELSLSINDIVTVTEKIDDYWLSGYINGRSGYFPLHIVQFILEDKEKHETVDLVVTSNKQKNDNLIAFSPEEPPKKAITKSWKEDLNDLDILNDDYFKQNMPSLSYNSPIGAASNYFQQQTSTKQDNYFANLTSTDYYEKEQQQDYLTSIDTEIDHSNDFVPYAITLYPFISQFQNELSFNEGEIVKLLHYVDKDWIKGEIDNRKGIFPLSYVKIVIDCENNINNEITDNTNVLSQTSLKENMMGKVLYRFTAQMNEDVSVEEGEIVTLLSQENNDWWKIKKNNGQIGLCPKNYLTNYEGVIQRANTISETTFPKLNKPILNRSASMPRRPSPPSSPPPSPPKEEEEEAGEESIEPASPVVLRKKPPLPQKPSLNKLSNFNRTGSDRTPHRPPPPVPVPGQVPVNRIKYLEAKEQNCEEIKTVPNLKQPEDIRLKRQEQRQNVISELALTEKEYIRDLKITYETFNLHNPEKLIDRGIDANVMFGNILEVTHTSENLVDKIQLAMKGKDDCDQLIGPCFLEMADELKIVYGQYCMNHENALILLEKYENDKEIQKLFEKGLETLRYQIACFDMSSILIKPVQRIMKYPLMLNELHKCTDDDHKDKESILAALHKMTQVASFINESKRRKDIVSKYLYNENDTLTSRMSRLSLHSVAKISTRFGMKLSTSLGLGVVKDNNFEEIEKKFNFTDKSIRSFVANVKTFTTNLHEVMLSQLHTADVISDFYKDEKPVANVEEFQKTQRILVNDTFTNFKQTVHSRVITPLTKLIEYTNGPTKLILKRNDKLLDYESCIIKNQNNKDPKLQEELNLAKHNYEALNSQLIEELPIFNFHAHAIYVDCINSFISARKLFAARITKLYLDLTELPVMIGCTGDVLESFFVKHNLICSDVGNFSFSSKQFKQENTYKRSSRPSISPKSLTVERSSRIQDQSPSRQAYLRSKYTPENLYLVKEKHISAQIMDLNVGEGQLVGILKKHDPMGGNERWFVDDGENKGFVAKQCLKPLYGEVEESREVIVRNKSPYADLPTYDEVVTPPASPLSAAASSLSTDNQSHLYEEIPDELDTPEYYYAAFEFIQTGDHLLSLSKGQVVKIIEKHDFEGNCEWWLVENRNGNKGYVPSNYLAKYQE